MKSSFFPSEKKVFTNKNNKINKEKKSVSNLLNIQSNFFHYTKLWNILSTKYFFLITHSCLPFQKACNSDNPSDNTVNQKPILQPFPKKQTHSQEDRMLKLEGNQPKEHNSDNWTPSIFLFPLNFVVWGYIQRHRRMVNTVTLKVVGFFLWVFGFFSVQ